METHHGRYYIMNHLAPLEQLTLAKIVAKYFLTQGLYMIIAYHN